MTKSEQAELQLLRDSIKQLTIAVSEFKQISTTQIAEIESKVKSQPISLEAVMLTQIQNSMADAIKAVLVGHKSPITPLVEEVIERNKLAITAQLNLAIDDAMSITQEDFTRQIKEKMVKSLVTNTIQQSGGLVDKTFNDLKQNPAFRAKLLLAVDSLLKEFN